LALVELGGILFVQQRWQASYNKKAVVVVVMVGVEALKVLSDGLGRSRNWMSIIQSATLQQTTKDIENANAESWYCWFCRRSCNAGI
jgi:hypothetical protein